MSVYVDKLTRYPIPKEAQAARVAKRNDGQWCHMWADTLDELHVMAAKLGLKQTWFQNHSKLPHYDLTPGKRYIALAAGAIEKSLIDHFRELRSIRTNNT